MAGYLDCVSLFCVLIIHIASREPIQARNWEAIGPEILKSKVIPPLFNQTSPGNSYEQIVHTDKISK